MKLFIVAVTLIFGAHALSKEQFEGIMKKVQEVGLECTKKENAESSDLADLIKLNFPPTTHGGKCIIACFYERYNIMKPDLSFDKEAVSAAFHELKSMDEEMYGKVMKIADICDAKKQIVSDRCENASLMAACVKSEADAMGITKEAFLTS